MIKRKITKKKIMISLDKAIVKRLKASKTKTSTLINTLLLRHYSLLSSPHPLMADNRVVPCSNSLSLLKVSRT